jgi:hypothetical protein
MAQSVKMTTDVVASKGIEISVSDSQGNLGTLLIGKAGVEWLPASKSAGKYEFKWRKFVQKLEGEGAVKKARKPKKQKKPNN